MEPVVHIDGDILVFSCGFAAERGEYKLSFTEDGVEKALYFATKKELEAFLDNNNIGPHVVEFQRHPEPVEYALSNVKNVIGAIREELNVDRYFVYLSGPTNFRYELATIRPYKGNRDAAHRPVHERAIREYISSYHPHVVSDGDEADDAIGYTHYARWSQDPDSSIIATQDKDLNMIPGWHYNFKSQEKFYVDADQATRNFYHQLLTGDPTDNIQGVPRCGKVKATKLLAGITGELSMYKVVRKAYEEAKLGDAELLENARLLWIRREKGELWQPPKVLTE